MAGDSPKVAALLDAVASVAIDEGRVAPLKDPVARAIWKRFPWRTDKSTRKGTHDLFIASATAAMKLGIKKYGTISLETATPEQIQALAVMAQVQTEAVDPPATLTILDEDIGIWDWPKLTIRFSLGSLDKNRGLEPPIRKALQTMPYVTKVEFRTFKGSTVFTVDFDATKFKRGWETNPQNFLLRTLHTDLRKKGVDLTHPKDIHGGGFGSIRSRTKPVTLPRPDMGGPLRPKKRGQPITTLPASRRKAEHVDEAKAPKLVWTETRDRQGAAYQWRTERVWYYPDFADVPKARRGKPLKSGPRTEYEIIQRYGSTPFALTRRAPTNLGDRFDMSGELTHNLGMFKTLAAAQRKAQQHANQRAAKAESIDEAAKLTPTQKRLLPLLLKRGGTAVFSGKYRTSLAALERMGFVTTDMELDFDPLRTGRAKERWTATLTTAGRAVVQPTEATTSGNVGGFGLSILGQATALPLAKKKRTPVAPATFIVGGQP